MRTKTKAEPFASIVRRVLATQKRGLPDAQLAALVRAEIGDRRYREMASTGFERSCASAARQRCADGLPYASSVGGRIVPRHLWTENDYEYAIWTQARQARAATKRMLSYHAECGEKFNSTPDLDELLSEIDFDAIAKEVIAERRAVAS